MERSKFLCCISLAAALVLPNAPRAWANSDGDIESYRSAVRRGATLFREANYDEARAEFSRAYRLHPAPILLFNIASTYRRQQRHADALRYYRRFVRVASKAEPRRQLAVETIGHLEALVAERRRRRARETVVEPEQPAPEPQALPQPAVMVTRKARTRPRSQLLTWSGVAMVAGGLAGLTMAWQNATEATSIERELAEVAAMGQPWGTAEQNALVRGERAQTRALTWAIAGGVAVVGGATLIILGRPVRVGASPREIMVSTSF